MDQEEIQKKLFSARQTLQRLFQSESGLALAEMLENIYVRPSAVCDTPEQTYYKLGQKELIQDLIAHKDLDLNELFKMEI